jgi:hypothetical protein
MSKRNGEIGACSLTLLRTFIKADFGTSRLGMEMQTRITTLQQLDMWSMHDIETDVGIDTLSLPSSD